MNAFDLDFPAHIWAPFAQGRPPIRCSPGYLIYLQGTEATCFYYLKEGQVRSFIQSEDGRGAGAQCLRPWQPIWRGLLF